MEFQTPHFYCLFLGLLSLLSYSHAYIFYAGGRDGWVLNPSENYNQWAGRNRFQVNDTIVFKYKKGSNSVLVVNKDDYDKCNTKNPIKKFQDGDSQFEFDRSGPFFFISGDSGNCQKGQKLIVVVLAIRGGPKPQTPPPSPVSHPPAVAPSPAPELSPTSPSPAPGTPSAPSPATSPAPAPGATSPSPSPSPSAPSPAGTTPSPETPGSGETPAGGSGNPSSSSETAPSPPNGGSGSGAWSVTPSSLLVYSVTIVLGAALSGILGAQ